MLQIHKGRFAILLLKINGWHGSSSPYGGKQQKQEEGNEDICKLLVRPLHPTCSIIYYSSNQDKPLGPFFEDKYGVE